MRINNKQNLPQKGPAILIANHNSHIDVFALMSLFSFSQQQYICPVAAADYFLSQKWLAWFALNVLNIIPIIRKGKEKDPLRLCRQALKNNKILIFFPEGTRGKPGELSSLKSGLYYLVENQPEVQIIPVWIKGAERIMAKGNRIPLPLFIDINVGTAFYFQQEKAIFQKEMLERLLQLQPKNLRNEPY